MSFLFMNRELFIRKQLILIRYIVYNFSICWGVHFLYHQLVEEVIPYFKCLSYKTDAERACCDFCD